MVELLERRAAQQSGRVAFSYLGDEETEQQSLTYEALAARARRIAAKLRESLHPGDRALLIYPAGPEFLEAFFGCLYAGVIAVPAEVPRSERHLPRFNAIRDDSGAAAALTTRPALELVRRRVDPVAPLWLFTEDAPPDAAEPAPGEIAYLQYTSGSTSTPKGVIVSHANVFANLADIDAAFRHDTESVAVNWLPHFHDMGLVYGLLAPLWGGFRAYVMPPAAFVQRPSRWLSVVSKYGATHSGGPNFAYDLCLEKIAPEQRAGFNLSSWRVAYNGAEPVRRSTLESFAEAFGPAGFRFDAYHPAYGLAEATLKVTGRDPERPVGLDGDRVSCGIPGPNTEVEIVEGEICVRGAGVAGGYWNRTGDPAFEGGLLHTGDLGYLREGELYVTGRIKDLVIIRGRNLYPQDLELTAERAHEALRANASAAFGVDDGGSERLALVIEIERGREGEAHAAIHAIRRHIAETHEVYAWSVVLVQTGTIPKTSSGKIQRQLTRQRYLGGELAVVASSTGLPEFEPAADSLAALERKMELEREYGVEVPITALLGGGGKPRELDELAAAREPVLSIEQERLWLLDQIEHGNPALHVPAAVDFEEPVDLARLEQALAAVVHRHTPLRTTFPKQPVVQGQMRVEIRRGPMNEAFVREPFDLAGGPLFRLTLDERRLGAVFHHIVADLWSAAIFFRDLARVYRGEKLAPLAWTYSDFAAWQRKRVESGALDESISFWRRKLERLPSLSWPNNNAHDPGVEDLALPAWLGDPLHHFSTAHHSTLAMALLAAWQAALCRVTGQEDLIVATPVAGRPRSEFLEQVGFFAYPVLLRTDLCGDPSFSELLDRTRAVALEAYEHAEVPFAKVVEAASGGGHCSVRAPLAQVVFNFVRETESGPGLRPADAPGAPTDFNAFLTVVEHLDGRLRAVLSHNLGPAGKALATLYANALEQAATLPDSPISSLAPVEGLQMREFQTIAVAATFTAEPLEPILDFWMQELRVPAKIRFAPYGQVFQSLLDPSSLLSRNGRGVNVVLVRLADLPGEAPAELAAALRKSAATSRTPMLAAICPSGDPAREDALLADLSRIPGISVLAPDRVASLYPVETITDPHAEELGHVPYMPEYFTALGTTLARAIAAVRRAPRKVVVLDCDQTLWKGVCGEDGPEGIVLDAGRLALQREMLRQHQAGILLALCSKNNEEDVDAVFEVRRDMPLTADHFVARRVNWHPKPDNLRALARELMLGLDSFIFIDDNRVECAAVRASLPEVLTVELPENPEEIEPLLRHLWPLDHLRVTEEDRARPQMYRQDAQRRALGKQSVSLAGFLAGLDLRVRVAPPSLEQLERTAQLTQRTNQFNCAGVRRTASELGPLAGGIRVIEVSDRFGDYGLVGVMIFDRSADALLVDSFLLSCRALGRGIEHRMLAELGRIAALEGLKYVDVSFTPTRKNRPALHFLDQAGAESRRSGGPLPDGPATIYRFLATSAAMCEYKPEDTPPAEDQEGETNPTPQPAEPIDWVRFAREYQSVEAIQAAARARNRSAAVPAASVYTAPRTPLEAELSELWTEMLHLPQAGVDEDFFVLGGHSLLAVQLLSRVRDRYDVDLSLDVVFGGRFTVAELAQAIETAEIERAGTAADALLAEIEGLSDEEARELLRAGSGQGGP